MQKLEQAQLEKNWRVDDLELKTDCHLDHFVKQNNLLLVDYVRIDLKPIASTSDISEIVTSLTSSSPLKVQTDYFTDDRSLYQAHRW